MSRETVNPNSVSTQARRFLAAVRKRLRVLRAAIFQPWHQHHCPLCQVPWFCQSGLCEGQICSSCEADALRQLAEVSPSCPDANVLAAFVESRLSLQERQIVVAHMASCDECRTVVLNTLKTIEAIAPRLSVVQGGRR